MTRIGPASALGTKTRARARIAADVATRTVIGAANLPLDDVSRIHGLGGSILQTSRHNPTKSEKEMENVVAALREAGVTALVTIGGDDTAYSSYQVCFVK